jgi:hypothetical protein
VAHPWVLAALAVLLCCFAHFGCKRQDYNHTRQFRMGQGLEAGDPPAGDPPAFVQSARRFHVDLRRKTSKLDYRIGEPSGKAAIEIGSLVWYFCHVIFALSNEAVRLIE